VKDNDLIKIFAKIGMQLLGEDESELLLCAYRREGLITNKQARKMINEIKKTQYPKVNNTKIGEINITQGVWK
jgi:hypothetical protein